MPALRPFDKLRVVTVRLGSLSLSKVEGSKVEAQALLESAQTPYRRAGGKRLLERPRSRRQGGVEDLESNRKEQSRTKGLVDK